MKVGISTGCLYPSLTEKSLERLLYSGVDLFEIFFNTFSETEPDYLDRIKNMCDNHNARIRSIHPFTSSYESYLLFSGYERRFLDGVRFYDMYFRTAKRLGADYVVLHGMQTCFSSISEDEYIKRFSVLFDEGKSYGVTVLQENVWNHISGNNEFIEKMKYMLGDKAGFVLDTKQARRCGYTPESTALIMGSNLKHIHISDCMGKELCTLPGTGEYNFDNFITLLEKTGYSGDMIIEVYGNKAHDIPALIKAKNYLCRITEP